MIRAAREAGLLAAAALLLGLGVNALHPKGVRLFTAVPPRSLQDPRFIDLLAARERLNEGRVLFIDVRSSRDYAEGHIEGAWNLPAAEFDRHYPRVARFAVRASEVILYCESRHCPLALDILRRFQDLGIARVKIFEGGWEEWVSTGGVIDKRMP